MIRPAGPAVDTWTQKNSGFEGASQSTTEAFFLLTLASQTAIFYDEHQLSEIMELGGWDLGPNTFFVW